MDVKVPELWRIILLNCGVREDSSESLGLQGDPNQSFVKEMSLIFSGRTDAEAETSYSGHLMQRTDSLEKTLMLGNIERGGKGDNRAWDGWMASPTRWTCVWVNSRSWWWTGRRGVLRFMESEKLGHSWSSEVRKGSRQIGPPSATWGRAAKKAIYEQVGCRQKPNLPSPRSLTS